MFRWRSIPFFESGRVKYAPVSSVHYRAVASPRMRYKVVPNTAIPLAFAINQSPSIGADLASGARDTVPMLVGAAPFGFIFGALVAASPLSLWLGQSMSLAVFAGSSQFIGIGLLSADASWFVIVATTLIVNLRHSLYAATLLPHLRELPLRWRTALGFLLTDETFAVTINRLHRGAHPQVHWYMLGSGLAMYLNWQAWTLIGMVVGATIPGLKDAGLDFAMVTTFIAIVIPQLRSVPTVGAAIVAGTMAFLLRNLPYQLGLLVAVAAGIAAGLLLSRNRTAER
jgi:4-azaleucine resistance transporter AzlC